MMNNSPLEDHTELARWMEEAAKGATPQEWFNDGDHIIWREVQVRGPDGESERAQEAVAETGPPQADHIATANPLNVTTLAQAYLATHAALTSAEAALERLGSMEAFETSRMIDKLHDAELLARIEFARSTLAALKPTERSANG